MFHKYLSLNRSAPSLKQNIMDGETQIGVSEQIAGAPLQAKYKKFQESDVGNSWNLLTNLYDTFHSY